MTGGYADELVQRAATLRHDDPEAAERLLREALELDPTLRQGWFDLALLAKARRDWELCLAANRHAMELAPGLRGGGDPAAWDAGIAATALHDWDAAAHAWSHYGLAPDQRRDLGTAVVRLDPAGGGECVWGERLDPARMQLTTVPHPASGHRWGDVVVHDGEQRGVRTTDTRSVPVFDELEPWSMSDVPTVRVLVTATPPNLAPLYETFAGRGWPFVNWTTSVELRCPACSWGDVAAGHRHPTTRPDARQDIGVAGPPDEIDAAVREWERWRRDRTVIDMAVVA